MELFTPKNSKELSAYPLSENEAVMQSLEQMFSSFVNLISENE